MKNLKMVILVSFVVSLFLNSCSVDDSSRDLSRLDASQETIEEVEIQYVNPVIENTGPYPCENGLANGFPCDNYDLLSLLSFEQLGFPGAEGNDSWGWTDPLTGKEYVLMCTTKGTSFVDITDPVNPIVLGKITTATVDSIWRDVKVYQNHAFIVSEASNHGMQVFDLTRLRNVQNPPQEFTPDLHFTGFGRAHNIVINEQSGYAYIVGTSTNGGATRVINIQNPLAPVIEVQISDYAHDAQVVNYDGPDQDYVGKEIFIGSNETMMVIVDVTDKSNPSIISTIDYPNVGYTHQGWFTKEKKFFVVGDETDEMNFGNTTRSIVFNFEDLDNPVKVFEYTNGNDAIDHNLYILGDLMYQANYASGLRVVNVANIEGQQLSEVGYFDTYPENDNTSFYGAWNVYPFFTSESIVISDINRGLFVVKNNNNLGL